MDEVLTRQMAEATAKDRLVIVLSGKDAVLARELQKELKESLAGVIRLALRCLQERIAKKEPVRRHYPPPGRASRPRLVTTLYKDDVKLIKELQIALAEPRISNVIRLALRCLEERRRQEKGDSPSGWK